MTTTRSGPRRDRRRTLRRMTAPALAGGLVAAALPLGVTGAAAAAEEPAFSGYAGEAWAAPVRLEIYEPVLPIPASPQLEVLLGYSTVEADSGSGQARASYLWPGDPLGEGLKTFMEQLGVPADTVASIAPDGYPVQVNAAFPGGPQTQADEPLPGAVMRTQAGEDAVVARAGFAGDCDVEPPKATTPGLPGLPKLPGLPSLTGLTLPTLPGLPAPSLPGLPSASGTASGSASGSAAGSAAGSTHAAAAAEAATPCQLPTALSALVDVTGFSSTSRSTRSAGTVVTSARSSLGDVSLLGGLVTFSGFEATSTTTSDGKKGTVAASTSLGKVTIAGQTFDYGPDGFAGAPRLPIPALPDDPAKALKRLGITISTPAPVKSAQGEAAEASASALVVEVDTEVLSPLLSRLPIAQLIEPVQFPAELAILKGLIAAIPDLSPRIVLTLGTASSTVETVQGIELPDIPTGGLPGGATGDGGAPGAGDGATPGGPGAAGGGGGDVPGAGLPGTEGTAGTPGAEGSDDAAAGTLPPSAQAAGLPPLFSIPGMLLLGGVVAAATAGSWLRKIGALALGGGAACPHGLDSGLPDLRKA